MVDTKNSARDIRFESVIIDTTLFSLTDYSLLLIFASSFHGWLNCQENIEAAQQAIPFSCRSIRTSLRTKPPLRTSRHRPCLIGAPALATEQTGTCASLSIWRRYCCSRPSANASASELCGSVSSPSPSVCWRSPYTLCSPYPRRDRKAMMSSYSSIAIERYNGALMFGSCSTTFERTSTTPMWIMAGRTSTRVVSKSHSELKAEEGRL